MPSRKPRSGYPGSTYSCSYWGAWVPALALMRFAPQALGRDDNQRVPLRRTDQKPGDFIHVPHGPPAHASDRERWEPLWIGYQTFYRRTLTAEMVDLSWWRFMDPTSGLDAYGAFDGERMVGLVHITMQTLTSFEKPACYLSDLFTDESVRGKGIGRALIEHVYAVARERNCERVYWLTAEDNTAGRILYDKVAQRSGFIHYWKKL